MNEEVVVDEVVDDKPKKPMTPEECREFLLQELVRGYPGIVAGFLGAAAKGSVGHFKLVQQVLEKQVVEEKKRDPILEELWEFGTPEWEKQEARSGGE